MMKTRQDNDLINHIGVVYVESDIELSWSTRRGAVYDENQRGQQCDQLDRVPNMKKII